MTLAVGSLCSGGGGSVTVSCSVAGCANPSYVRGWCPRHYTRWQRHGNPDITLRPRGGTGRRPRLAGLPARGPTATPPGVLTVKEATAVPPTGDPDWQTRAACRTADLDMFHPEPGQPANRAKAVCARCPVLGDCREYALSLPLSSDRHGIYGGLTPDERQLIRRRTRRTA